MRRNAILSIACLILAACTPVQWVKPGATPDDLNADSADCQQKAWREAQYRSWWYYGPPAPYIARDGLGRRFLVWPYSPFNDPFHDRFMEEARLAQFCMQAKGWELQPVEPKK